MERNIIRHYGDIEVHCNSRMLVQGLFLALLGLLGPLIVSQRGMGIYDDLAHALFQNDAGALLLAGTKLVFMNVCRMTPHYMGAFLLNDSMHVYYRGKRHPELNVLFTYAMILGIYRLIYLIYTVRYDFGIPAVLTVAFVLILSYMDLFSVRMANKIIMVFTLLMSIQCLDVVPGLTEYGFGRGEVSMDVKEAAAQIHQESALRTFMLITAAVFFLSVLIQVQLLMREHVLKVTEEKNLRMEKELYDTQIEALKMRHASEVQSLVHDLKSPLTTVQGLVSLAEMMEENKQIRTYFGRISAALGNMNDMISEILYEDRRDTFTMEELMRGILAEISIYIPSERVRYQNGCPESRLNGNKIRLTRAVINLINNSWSAVSHEKGVIEVTVDRRSAEDGRNIRIVIADNGDGIPPEKLDRIWELGYSGRGSTGLGLAFTRQVIENHGGTIEIRSETGKYTRAFIYLRENKQEASHGRQEDTGD